MEDTNVDGAANSIEPSTIKFEDLVKDESFVKQMQPYLDAHVGKAVEAYKEKGFATAVEKKVSEALKQRETKTPEQIRFEEYEAKLSEMQNKIREKDLLEMKTKNKELAREEFKKSGLPEGLLDFFVSEDSEVTKKNIEVALKELVNFQTSLRQSVLSGNNIRVPGNDSGSGLKEPGENATKEQWKEYYRNKK